MGIGKCFVEEGAIDRSISQQMGRDCRLCCSGDQVKSVTRELLPSLKRLAGTVLPDLSIFKRSCVLVGMCSD